MILLLKKWKGNANDNSTVIKIDNSVVSFLTRKKVSVKNLILIITRIFLVNNNIDSNTLKKLIRGNTKIVRG